MFSVHSINSVLPHPPKIEKKKRVTHQDGHRDVKKTEYNKEGFVKDIELADDKKDDMSMYEKNFQEIFENMSGPHPLTEPSTNFPGVYPGTSYANFSIGLRLAAADLKMDLLKALTRAQELGMIKDYKTALIEVGGAKYTYDKLPEQLISKAIEFLQGKMEQNPEKPQSPEQQQQSQQVQQFTDALSAPMPVIGGELPMGQPDTNQPNPTPAPPPMPPATAAARFPANSNIPGETSLSMPEQTDNPSVVDQGPVAPKQTKPMKQYDGAYPWIEDGQGKENPHMGYMDDMLQDVQYFFGI